MTAMIERATTYCEARNWCSTDHSNDIENGFFHHGERFTLDLPATERLRRDDPHEIALVIEAHDSTNYGAGIDPTALALYMDSNEGGVSDWR
jgi:hypothetical protein